MKLQHSLLLGLQAILFAGPAGREAEPRARWETAGSAYARDPRLSGLRAFLDSETPRALERAYERLGLAPGPVPLRWRLDLEGPEERPEMPVEVAPPYLEGGRTGFSGAEVLVTLPARKYLSRPRDALPVLHHEAAHAVLASAAGSRATYESCPRWLREGLAVWFAGEGAVRVREAMVDALFKGRPADSFLCGVLGAHDENSAGHAESFLAVAWLEERLGIAGLRRLALAASRGESVPGLLAAELGAASPRLRAESLAFARGRIQQMLPPASERLFAESLVLRARRDAEAAPIWSRLLDTDPSGALGNTLRYLLARNAIRGGTGGAGGCAAARPHLEKLLEAPDVLWRPEAMVLLGECLRAEGDRAGARALWQDVLDAFGEDPLPALRARENLKRS